MKACIYLLLCLSFPALHAAPAARNDGKTWPTLHGDLQRSGFYPHFPDGPLKLSWRKELWRELTGPRAEVIVGGGLAFMGSYAGNVYAWDAASGQQRWVFKSQGPISHSPSFDDGMLYVGSMDHKLYAVEAATGKLAWSFEAEEGISVSPVVHNGMVLFGARDSVFYAVRQTSGALAWKFQTGDRILTSASISDDGEKVLFASEDMHLYCVNIGDGSLLWKSRKMAGLSARDYAPVICKDLVFVTTNPVKDFHTIMGENENMLVQRTGFKGKDTRYIPGAKTDVESEQECIVEFLKKHPEEQVFYAFRLTDGSEPWIAPLLYTGGLHNPLAPPCYNPLTGEVFTLVRSAYGIWDGGGEVRAFTGFGKLDLQTGRVQLLEHGYKPKEPGRPAGAKDTPWGSFNYIGDETQVLSCAPDYLFSNHQGFLGSMNLKAGTLSNKFGKRDSYGGFYGPAAFGWENNGGYQKAVTVGQPYGLVNEWHGPARAIVSAADNRVFFHTGSQVLCLEAKQ